MSNQARPAWGSLDFKVSNLVDQIDITRDVIYEMPEKDANTLLVDGYFDRLKSNLVLLLNIAAEAEHTAKKEFKDPFHSENTFVCTVTCYTAGGCRGGKCSYSDIKEAIADISEFNVENEFPAHIDVEALDEETIKTILKTPVKKHVKMTGYIKERL